MTPEFILDVLKTFADHDDCDSLQWQCKGDSISFYVLCSDLFYWACADAETITPENLPILKQSFADVKKLDDCQTYWASQLFACRVRGMRPQLPINEQLDKVPGMRELFDACGPDRTAKECG